MRFDLECIRAARVLGASSLGREKNVVRFQRLGGEWNTEDLDLWENPKVMELFG